MRRGARLVGLLWRWHRRIGVVAAVFVLMLAVTGIVLNHTSQLGLDQRFIDSSWLTRLYGDDSSALPAYKPGEQWVYRAATGIVYLDDAEVAACNGDLVGALRTADFLVASCREQLLLLTPAGELLESIGPSMGLPVPLAGLGMVERHVVLQTADGWLMADLERIDFGEPAPSGALIQQLAPGVLPSAILQKIPTPQAWLSWERLLLDLHSGRVLGKTGVIIVDAVGVVLAALAMSGLAMWWLHRRRRQTSAPRKELGPRSPG